MNRKSRLLTRFAQVTCLLVIAVAVAAPGCNLLGGSCPSMDGNDYSGGDGAGGAGGGGDDDGFGGDSTDPDQGNVGGVGPVGAGGSSSFDTGAGAGDSSDVGAGAGSEHGGPGHHRARRPVRRHRHGSGLGTAVQADQGDCTPLNVPPPPSMMPPVPNWVGLDTGKLRTIAIANDIKGCATQTGVTQNRTIGVAFETWVLKMYGWLPRWNTSILSPQRVLKNMSKPGGLPKSVIPEKVLNQTSLTFPSVTWVDFPMSVFAEVKAVTKPLTLGTSQWQILGLIDGVSTWPTVPAMAHAPPAVFFTTTSNTIVTQPVVDNATTLHVAVWQAQVFYDANSADPTNPNLSIQQAVCLNDTVYAPLSIVIWPNPTAQNPLTWPTDPERDAVDAVPDPDDPGVDAP